MDPIRECAKRVSEALGFTETSEMEEIQQSFFDCQDPELCKEKYKEWDRLATIETEKVPSSNYYQAQMGLSLAKVAMMRLLLGTAEVVEHILDVINNLSANKHPALDDAILLLALVEDDVSL